MKILERWLAQWPWAITCVCALLMSIAAVWQGAASETSLPFGDGEHYVLRAMTLYGFLHSGQWPAFWDAFTLPRQSLAPLHYWLFFLLPRAWASMTSYGLLQLATTYGLLAFAVTSLCRALDRPIWAPTLFLLCAAQNVSMDPSYFYFQDFSFLAVGTLALAWQVRAWRKADWRSSLLSGAGAAALFWVKAPNAVIFVATYLLAELVRAFLTWSEIGKRDGAEQSASRFDKGRWFRIQARHALWILVGFLPLALLALLVCGGYQSIIRLIDLNEVSGTFSTTLECRGLFRLFYFPLCLAFFYHALLLVWFFTAGFLFALVQNRRSSTVPPQKRHASDFPSHRLLPLLVVFIALGEVFSFGMANKEMRSLLIVLPVVWLGIFWLLESLSVRPALIFLAAAGYVLCGYSQTLFDTFRSEEISTESFQLKNGWMARLPAYQWKEPATLAITKNLVSLMRRVIPAGSSIAVGSEQTGLTSESLTWALQYRPALEGRQENYVFNNFLSADGKFSRPSLRNARAILVFLHPALQYSPDVQRASFALVQFCARSWWKQGIVQLDPILSPRREVTGCLVIMNQPLTNERITQLVQGCQATELPPDANFGIQADRRLTWHDFEETLARWWQKRFGPATP